MKNAVLMFLLLGLVFSLSAVPRNLVVVEIATGTWCGYCPGAAMGAHDLLANGHAVAIIKNHNGDNYANTYSNARNSYYGVSGYPTAYFDGLNASVGGSATQSMYSNYLPKVNARLQVPSKYEISAVGNAQGNDYTVMVTVSKPEADTNTGVKLHAVLTQSNIPFNWGNQTTVDNVNRLMSPNQNGTNISLETGEQTTETLTFTMNSAWDVNNCEMVFFLQNNTSKEILQGVKYSLAELVGAYPVSHETINFPNQYVGGTTNFPIVIRNFGQTAATGTLAINNSVFSLSANTFNIPPAQSLTVNVGFTPTSDQVYNATLSINGNLYNHPEIEIPVTGTGFFNDPPVAEDVMIIGPPIVFLGITGSYTYTDPDGDAEGGTTLRWYRYVNDSPLLIVGQTEAFYQPQEEDLGLQLAFEVIPRDAHGMAGPAVVSNPTPPIEVVPPPRNLAATLEPPNTVVLTWERPMYFENRAFVGYRLYRDGLNISTITNANTLTFRDTYVQDGVHEYWICSLFNNPHLLSGPSNVATISINVDSDDHIAPPASVSFYPNPFKDSSAFEIQTKAMEEVSISIFNIKGQMQASWSQKADANGNIHSLWDGKDQAGKRLNSGVYYYKIESPNLKQTGKIIKIN